MGKQSRLSCNGSKDAHQSESEKDPTAYKVNFVNAKPKHIYTTPVGEAKMCFEGMFFYDAILNLQVWSGGARLWEELEEWAGIPSHD